MTIFIDQQRGSVSAGGRMTQKRTLHDLRKIAKKRSADWWARVFDETIMCYLAGARGVNSDFVYPTTWTGRANNSLTAPDASHLIMPGATVKATLASTNKFELALIDKAVANAEMMGGGNQEVPKIQPINIDGEMHYVVVMNPWQAHDLRTATGEGKWLDLQKAATQAEGSKNNIFKGTMGMHNNVLMHKHQAVVRFSDYGSGNNVLAARALFLGAQAAALSFGSPGNGLRFDWHEETQNRGNELVITTHAIWGCKKNSFNGVDFGVMAIDTAAAAPV
jgi:N4-gp56 family major capsid protein